MGGILTVVRDGNRLLVTVTSIAEPDTLVTATLVVSDATPSPAVTVAILVTFYSLIKFDPSLVTHTVAAGFTGGDVFAKAGGRVGGL